MLLRLHQVALLMCCLIGTASCGVGTSVEGQPGPEPRRVAAEGAERPGSLTPAEQAEVPTVHVYPGQEIQEALDRAAESTETKRVLVHAGTYRPAGPRQALIWFNARHDGITLEAEGEVVLTAANPEVADTTARSFPAVVNHVVYFGDGIGPETVLRGFRITGANNFVTRSEAPSIQPDLDEERLKKTLFFYTDGGGIKIFGRSYPTLENLTIADNYSSPCGAGISVEHRGFTQDSVTIRNCIFRNNRVPLTGAAVDLLDHKFGSSAVLENCLFIGNLSNCSRDALSRRLGTWKPQAGHGAVTVFPHSRAVVRRCTFVANRNGVDDLGEDSTYEGCIFWQNDAEGGWVTGQRYAADIKNGQGVEGCFFGGPVVQRDSEIDRGANHLDAPKPDFNEAFVPQNPVYRKAGYRPVHVGDAEPRAPADNHVSGGPPGRAIIPGRDGRPLKVLLRGRDFRWHITYAGADGKLLTSDDLRTERDLRVPAGVDVEVQVESDDYLYTVALPEFDAREIAVPDLTHRLRFTTERPGSSPLLGDQLCGYSHPDLIGEVIVQTPAEFAAWCEGVAFRQP